MRDMDKTLNRFGWYVSQLSCIFITALGRQLSVRSLPKAAFWARLSAIMHHRKFPAGCAPLRVSTFCASGWSLIFLLCGLLRHASAQNVTYSKIEAAFSLPAITANQFDYTSNDVRVLITQPDTTTVLLPAFFDGGTTWRVRHTPLMPGTYSVTGVTLNGATVTPASLLPASWNVAGPAISPGYVRIDPGNPSRFITSNGRRYFPIGHDNAWDVSSTTNVAGIMARLGGSHENWSRVWMNHWDNKNLDWPPSGAALPFGTFSLSVAQKWDSIVAAAEQAGVHFQMTLQHHGQYSTTVDSNWPQNPYNVVNGGFLTVPEQFFTNAQAIALTQKKMRYSIARWGYSTSIMAWELFNEVQFTDAGLSNQWSIIEAWHNQMAAFMRSQDPYHHLITTSSVLNEPIWDATDYYTHHDYPSDLIGSIQDAPTITASQPVAPVFGSECGMDFTPHIGVTPTAWAGLMAAQSGNEEPWYWDVIDANNDYTLMRALTDFASYAGIGDHDSFVKSSPAVTCAQNTALVFAPGGGYADATQSAFTVGQSTPTGIGSLPSFLQGTYHKSMTPDGYTFLVNYPQAGTFTAQVTMIASSGDGLQIILDSATATNISFPAASADYATNYNLTINVPAGQHTITLTNPGLDWVVLGNLSFNPYVPMIAAYQISDSQFAALWLWHRTNIYLTNATSTLSAQVALVGLSPGTYSATWWDTYAGAALSNFTFSVANTNTPVTLNTPPILRSVALYAGLPPHATINAPTLTQTVGSNAPAFSVPLIITNSGGLPLSYSISVTGSTPVLYTAVNSTQPAGPNYDWIDISGVGTDITTNFTALASPKAATDEGIAGPFAIGFNFPFFNGAQTPGTYSQLYISPNGFVTFSPFTGDTSVAVPLPSASAPSNCIAAFWRDLALGSGGHVYTFSDALAGTFTVEFYNVPAKSGSGTFTGQIILKRTGEILFQYQTLVSPNNASIGLQDAARDQGLNIHFGSGLVQTNFAIFVTPQPWLTFDSTAGTVGNSAAMPVNLFFNATGLAAGTYSANLTVNSGDPLLPSTSFPVSFTVSPNLPAAASGLVVNSFTWSQVALSWSNNSASLTGYELQRATSPNGVFANIATIAGNATNFTDVTATSQTIYYYRLVATNSFGLSLPSASAAAATPLAPVDIWRQAHFGTPVNSGLAADDADLDHDGLVNLIEYAFGLNPLVASAYPIAFNATNNFVNLVFKRPHLAPLDINYIPETAPDLTSGDWSSAAGTTTQTVVNNNDGTETVTITDTASITANATHYLRLRIARQ